MSLKLPAQMALSVPRQNSFSWPSCCGVEPSCPPTQAPPPLMAVQAPNPALIAVWVLYQTVPASSNVTQWAMPLESVTSVGSDSP